MKKLCFVLCLVLLLTACGAVPGEKPEKWEIVVITNDAESDFAAGLEQGVRAYSKPRDHVNAYVDMGKYPPDLQVPLVEDFIAQEVDAICVFPVEQKALDPMLQKAREAGIVVLSCGGPELAHVDFDLEPAAQQKSIAVIDPVLLGQVLPALAVQVLEGVSMEGEIALDVEGCPTAYRVPDRAHTIEADYWTTE